MSAIDQLRVSKSLFVLPPTFAAEKNTTGTEVVRQRVTIRFRIVAGFIVRGAAMEDQSGDVDVVFAALLAALVGWKVDNTGFYTPANFVAWSVAPFAKDKATLFMAADFLTTAYVRSIP